MTGTHDEAIVTETYPAEVRWLSAPFALLPLLLALEPLTAGAAAAVFVAGVVGFCGTFAVYRTELRSGPLRVETVWGVVVPWGRAATALPAPRRIRVTQVVRGSGRSRRVSYPVAIVSDTVDREVNAPSTYLAARRLGERLARLAWVELDDAGLGDVVVRPPERLDAWVRDATREEERRAPRPAGARVQASHGERISTVRVKMAPAAWIALAISLVPALIIGGLFGLFAMLEIGTAPPVIAAALVGLAVLPLVIAVVAFIASGWAGSTIRVDREALTVRGKRLPLREVEELRVAEEALGVRLVAVTDKQLAVLARGLTAEELRYLRAELLVAMDLHA